MKALLPIIFVMVLCLNFVSANLVADHNSAAVFGDIPVFWLDKAREDFRIGYAHTSHGSHPRVGMSDIHWDVTPGVPGSTGNYPYRFDMQYCTTPGYTPDTCIGNSCINDPNIFLQDYSFCFGDIGDYPEWITHTQDTLLSPSRNRNVIMWSIGCELSPDCSISSGIKITSIEELHSHYLDPMLQFINDNPSVQFILQTGQLDASGSSGQVHQFNEYIRNFAATNDIILFDFADIERYDPDGNDYLDLGVGFQNMPGDGDGCKYGATGEGNWCNEWCADNPSYCLNMGNCVHVSGEYGGLSCRLKGVAFWHLLARMAGWTGDPTCVSDTECESLPTTPTITSVNNNQPITDGATSISIRGSGFGSKSPAAPHIWDDFETGSNTLQVVSPTIGDDWTVAENIYYDNADVYSGSLSGHSPIRITESGHPGLVKQFNGNNPYEKGFLSMKIKQTSTFGTAEPHNIKFVRLKGGITSNYNTGYPLYRIGNDRGYTTFNKRFGTTCGVNGNLQTLWNVPDPVWGEWNDVQMYGEFGTDGQYDGIAGLRMNGQLDHIGNALNNCWTDFEGATNEQYWTAGFTNAFFGAFMSHDGSDADQWLDDLYADTTLARVEIHDGSNFANSNVEMQIPSYWTGSEIRFTANQGKLIEGQTYYLFVIDENGEVSNSHPITFGEQTTDPYITGLSNNELTDGASIDITGMNFGTKSPVEPLRYDNFESGTVGEQLEIETVNSGWDTTGLAYPPTYSTSRTRTPNTQSAYQDYTHDGVSGANIGLSPISLGGTTDKLYFSGWFNMNTSGALSRNVKILNMYSGTYQTGFGWQTRIDVYPINPSGHMYVLPYCDGSGGSGSDTGTTTPDVVMMDDGQWHRMEGWLDMGTPGQSDGYRDIWTDRIKRGSLENVMFHDGACYIDSLLIGHYFANDEGTPTPRAERFWDEIYVDTTQARIEICNNENYLSATHCEIQIPESGWDDTTERNIRFIANQGSFTDTEQLWLFVIDENGTASNGRAVSFGTGIPSIPQCQEGEITTLCNCGGANYNSGYCCSDTWERNLCTTPPPINIYDIYVDGRVDILDLLELANNYGTTSTINDYDGNGKINILDLLELINNFS